VPSFVKISAAETIVTSRWNLAEEPARIKGHEVKRVCLVGLALAAVAAHAEVLLAVSYDGKTYHIDSDTGIGTGFGPGGLGNLNALAYHQGTFYAAGNSFQLTSIDPDTGNVVDTVGLGTSDLRGLASTGSVLYGVVNGTGMDDSDVLVTIDPVNGIVSTVGKMGLPYNAVQALAAWHGQIYAWDINLGLLTVDAATGVATDVGDWTGTGDIQALEFLADGTLVGGRDKLMKVDLTTGGFSLIGGAGYSDVRGLAVVPEPALTLGLLLCLGALRRQRR